MKKLFLFISMIFILMTLFTINVLAKDVEIGKCDTSDPICVALQEKYGTDSTVLYSTAETTTCVNQLTVNVNGEDRIVYVSAKPGSDNEVVAPPPVIDNNPGTIPDDGIVIKPGDTGINEIELPKIEVVSDNLLSSENIVDNPITAVNEISIHNKLIEIYGKKVNAYWNTVGTERCKYASSLSINGTQVTVYLSFKPSTENVNVQMGEDGKLVIDGIESSQTSFDLSDRIHSVNNNKAVYPYNELNKKLIYVFGNSLYYFSEDEYEQVKTLLINAPQWWKEFYMKNGINAWIEDNFYKTMVETIDEYGNKISKVLYLSIEPTDDQRMVLKIDPTNHKNTENKVSIQQTVLIAIVVVILCGVIMIGGYCLIKRFKKSDTTQN